MFEWSLDCCSCIVATAGLSKLGVATKRGVGRGLGHGVGHGLSYGLPVVNFLKTVPKNSRL